MQHCYYYIITLFTLPPSLFLLISVKASTTFTSNQTWSHPQFFQLLPHPYKHHPHPNPVWFICNRYIKSTHFSVSPLPSQSKPRWHFTRTSVINLASYSYSCQFMHISPKILLKDESDVSPVTSGQSSVSKAQHSAVNSTFTEHTNKLFTVWKE